MYSHYHNPLGLTKKSAGAQRSAALLGYMLSLISFSTFRFDVNRFSFIVKYLKYGAVWSNPHAFTKTILSSYLFNFSIPLITDVYIIKIVIDIIHCCF